MTGARTALGGPTEELLLAYRGTAYFLRWLAQLPERAYGQPGAADAPADRRTTIATVGYDARGWAHLAEALAAGESAPRAFSAGERDAAIELGATLPPRALRHLVEHSAVHLAVAWRDLPADDWHRAGLGADGERLWTSDVPMLRARQTWEAAVALGNGAHRDDFPPELSQSVGSATRGAASADLSIEEESWHA